MKLRRLWPAYASSLYDVQETNSCIYQVESLIYGRYIRGRAWTLPPYNIEESLVSEKYRSLMTLKQIANVH